MEKIRTKGIIESTIYKDGGDVYYHVSVYLNDEVIKNVSSGYYSSKTKTLPKGKIVEVDFAQTKKGHKYVDIIGEDIIPVGEDLKNEFLFLGGFFAVLFLVILYFLLK